MSTQKLPEVFGDWIRVWGMIDAQWEHKQEIFAKKDSIYLQRIDQDYYVWTGTCLTEITKEVYESLVRLLSRDSMAYEPQPYNGKGLVPTGLHKVPPPEVTKAFARANGEG